MSTPISELPALHTTGTFPELAVYNHGLRMDAVINALTVNGIQSVIDLGCGDGALVKRIISNDLRFERYLGIDSWQERIDTAESDLASAEDWLTFIEGSMTGLETVVDKPGLFRHLGAVVMLETIEHVPRHEVSLIEDGVFNHITPDLVIVSTPDATKRLNEEQLAARGHYFEWDVPEFQDWALNITSRYQDYSVDIEQLTGPTFVRNTQIAVFNRAAQQRVANPVS